MQTVKDADDALLECGTTHNAVVDDDEVIHPRLQTAVRDVIDMRCEVVAAVTLSNEGTQLDVFNSHLLAADATGEDALQLLVAWVVA